MGSLFSGIGGIDLGLEWAGFDVRWQVEIDGYASRVLARRWPDVVHYRDVRDLSASTLEAVECLAGGFPCQPVSQAGKRKAQADPRWLWPEFARLVDELRPKYVIVENVPGIYSAGGADVVADLATLGFDAEWHSISAAAFGAPHLRERFILVAYSNSERRERQRVAEYPDVEGEAGGQLDGRGSWRWRQGQDVAYPEILTERPRLRESQSSGVGGRRSGDGGSARDIPDTDSFDTGHVDDGGSAAFGNKSGRDARGREPIRGEEWWIAEPDVGRVADGVPARMDRLRGLGNAVVPQVFEWVGRSIMQHARSDLDS